MHKCEFSKLDGLVNKVGWQNNSLILAPNLSVVCVNNKILESDWFSATLVNKGNGTDWNLRRSAIVQVINKIGRRCSGRPIC